MSSKQHAYFPYIDGMRALAVLAVIVYHLHGAWLPGGFSGVDVFFVISGFVVTASVLKYPREKGLLHYFAWFYSRRMQRILPALITCLLLTALASAIFIPSAWLSEANIQTGKFAFFGLSNFILAATQNDYFSPRVEFNPYTHTWSLGVEEQFYLIFPLIMLLWILGGIWRRLAVVATVLSVVASVGVAWWLAKTNPTYGFYMIVSRFWELGAGALMAIFFRYRHRGEGGLAKPSIYAQLGFVVSIAAIFLGMLISRPESFPFPGALFPVLGAVGVIAFLHGRQTGGMLTVALVHPLTLYIGRLSYSLYLWHWPVFVLFRWTVGLDGLPQQACAVFLVMLLSMASYHFVEKPLRYSSVLKRLPNVGVALAGITAAAVGWWGATSITANEPRISQSTVTRHAQDWYPAGDVPVEQQVVCDAALDWQNFNGAQVLRYNAANCKAGADQKRTLFLIGDSHAGAYDPMMRAFVRRTGISVFYYSNGGCPFVSFDPDRDIRNPGCMSNIKTSLDDMLSRAKPGDLLFMAGLRMPRFVDQFARFDTNVTLQKIFSNDAERGRAETATYAAGVLKQFTDKGVKIVVEAPKPVFRQVPYRCSDWFNRSNPICLDPSVSDTRVIARDEFEKLRAPTLGVIEELHRSNPSIYVWDPVAWLCTVADCRTANAEGRPLFFDGDHISGYASAALVASFSERVKQVLAGD